MRRLLTSSDIVSIEGSDSFLNSELSRGHRFYKVIETETHDGSYDAAFGEMMDAFSASTVARKYAPFLAELASLNKTSMPHDGGNLDKRRALLEYSGDLAFAFGDRLLLDGLDYRVTGTDVLGATPDTKRVLISAEQVV